MHALLALLPLIIPAQAHNSPFQRSHHPPQLSDRQLRELAQRELEERLMPITATTTLIVEQTLTQTVWVEATDQVIFPIPSASASVSSAPSSQSAEPSSSQSASEQTESQSAISSFTAPAISASTSHSASLPSNVLTANPISSSARSSAPSPTRSSASGEPRPSPTHAASASSGSAVSESTHSAYSTSASVETSSASTSASDSSVSASPTESSSSGYSSEYSQSVSSSYSSAEPSWAESSSSIIASVSASASYASASASYSSASAVSSSASAASSSASPTPSSAAGSSGTLKPLPGTLMNAYYPDWSGWYLTPENVDWSRFDVIDFAFALPTADGGLEFTQWDSSDLLNRLVSTGHAAGKRVKLSIGGWTGSAYFSIITADSDLRATFVNNILQAYKTYDLDGIDIDWEYPGVGGAAGNAVSGSDSANYLTFLQDLRAALPADALITTATQVWPFADDQGDPLTDVSGFAEVLDWILIMNYDIWGSAINGENPGPNAPLSNACGNSTQPLANAYAAVASWTSAGMPASKITLGVPAYGYISGSTANSLKQRRSSFPQPPHKRGLHSNSTSFTLQARGDVTVTNGGGGTTDGQIMFEDLLSQGALKSDGKGGFVGANGFVRHWDSCSSTPWLKSVSSGQIVTYDDTESMSLKGQFAAQAGIRGCNIFSIDGDWTGSSWPLTDAVRSGLGL